MATCGVAGSDNGEDPEDEVMGIVRKSVDGESLVCIDLEKLVESFADNCGGNLVSFDESLAKLEKVDPRMVRVIELYFFGAQPVTEIAKVLDSSERTVGRELNAAKLCCVVS